MLKKDKIGQINICFYVCLHRKRNLVKLTFFEICCTIIAGDDMKKGVLACFLICTFFLTGCGNKLTCTMNTTDEGRKTITTIDVDFKDDNVSEVNEKIVITFDDNYTDTIETLYNTINENYKQYEDEKGIKIETSRGDDNITVNINIIPELQKDSENNLINVETTRKELIADLTGQGYTCN